MTQRLLQCLFLSSLLSLAGCGHMLASMESDTIEEDQGERTWGRLIEDDSIETKARVNIHAADEAFDNAHLNIVSYNGYVLLVGQVASEALKSKATDVVREIRGVRRMKSYAPCGPVQTAEAPIDNPVSLNALPLLVAVRGGSCVVAPHDGAWMGGGVDLMLLLDPLAARGHPHP